MPTRREDVDHLGAYNFSVEISGVEAGKFKSIEGLDAEIEVIEFQDGVCAVPAEDAKRREAPLWLIGEVGKRDLALVILPDCRDEHQVIKIPRGLLGLVGGCTLLRDELAEDAA